MQRGWGGRGCKDGRKLDVAIASKGHLMCVMECF
jgi:hypothetical protein